MHRNRAIAGLSVAALVALAACGDAADDAVTGPMIKVAPGGGAGRLASTGEADSMSGEMASDMMIWMPTEFVLNTELAALDFPATGWYFPPSGELDDNAAARVIAALGLSGTPMTIPADLGGGWRLGPDDGTAPTIWFGRDGTQTWWYQPAWDAGVRGEMVCDEPAVSELVPESTNESPPEPGVCAEPQPPVGVPDEAATRAKAIELLTAMGVDPASYELQVYADDWSAWADAWILLDGKRAGFSWSVGFGGEGALTYASGLLGTPERTEPFPRVGTTVGFQRLQEGGQDWWWGGNGPAPYLADEPAVAVDADAGVSSDEALTGLPEPMPVDPTEQMEPLVIEIVDVREDLWTIYDADGGLWLVPAYAFLDADGGSYLVPAIGDETVEVVSEEPTPAEPPVEETVAPEPTDVPAPDETVTQVLPTEADLGGLVGLTEADAQSKVESAGWVFRVVEIDGEPLMATADYREDRVNVTLVGGLVTAATIG